MGSPHLDLLPKFKKDSYPAVEKQVLGPNAPYIRYI